MEVEGLSGPSTRVGSASGLWSSGPMSSPMDAFAREKHLLLRGVVAATGVAAVAQAWLGYVKLDPSLLVTAGAFGALSVLTATVARARPSGGFWALVATMTLVSVTYPALAIGDDAFWHAVVMVLFTGALMISPRNARLDGVWLIGGVVAAHSLGHALGGFGLEAGESFAMGAVATGATWLVWRMRGRIEAGHGQLRDLLEGAPVAIWQEDFSEVRRYLDSLEGGIALTREEIREAAARIRVVGVNQAAVDLVEAESAGQLLGSLNPGSITEETLAALSVQVDAVRERRYFVEADVVGRTLKGVPFSGILYWTAPRTDAGPDLSRVTVAITDVSRLRETERRLAETLEAKDRFAASVSHEIRTPLASVIGLASELAERYESFSDEERRELLGMVSTEAGEAAAIVEDLLVVARAESGNVSIHPDVFDVVRLAEDVAEASSSIPLIELPGVPLTVVADPLRVRQIIRNLLSNARRYGGPTVTLGLRGEGADVVVEVRDDGSGVPEGVAGNLFKAYQTAGKRSKDSIGLGLYVSRQLAELMGGSLDYERTRGETVFRLRLPAAERMERPEGERAIATGR